MDSALIDRLLSVIENSRPVPFETYSPSSLDEHDMSYEISASDQLSKVPLVSVYMTVYNHAPFLPEAIEGVCRQKCNFAFELIIGEDCSPDNSRAICEDYQRRYPHIIRLIVSDQNVGGLANSLRILKRGRGKYMAICEGDDFWTDETKLQKQVDAFENDPNISICYTDFTTLHMNTGVKQQNVLRNAGLFEYWHTLTTEDFLTELFLGYSFFATASIMVRSEDDKRRRKEPLTDKKLLLGDMAMRAYFSQIGKVHCISEDMVTYRLNDTGITQAKGEIGFLFRLDLLYMRILILRHISPEKFWSTLDFVFPNMTMFFVSEQEYLRQWGNLLSAFGRECSIPRIKRRLKMLALITHLPKRIALFAFRVFRRLT